MSEFKEALERINLLSIKNHHGEQFETMYGISLETIRVALYIADKATKGPNRKMYDAGSCAINAERRRIKAINGGEQYGDTLAILAYRAMMDRLIDEAQGVRVCKCE